MYPGMQLHLYEFTWLMQVAPFLQGLLATPLIRLTCLAIGSHVPGHAVTAVWIHMVGAGRAIMAGVTSTFVHIYNGNQQLQRFKEIELLYLAGTWNNYHDCRRYQHFTSTLEIYFFKRRLKDILQVWIYEALYDKSYLESKTTMTTG